MFRHRHLPSIMTVGCIVLLSVCYVGYRVYKNRVGSEEFILRAVAFERSLDKDVLPLEYRPAAIASLPRMENSFPGNRG